MTDFRLAPYQDALNTILSARQVDVENFQHSIWYNIIPPLNFEAKHYEWFYEKTLICLFLYTSPTQSLKRRTHWKTFTSRQYCATMVLHRISVSHGRRKTDREVGYRSSLSNMLLCARDGIVRLNLCAKQVLLKFQSNSQLFFYYFAR